jgi:hypothetical protein
MSKLKLNIKDSRVQLGLAFLLIVPAFIYSFVWGIEDVFYAPWYVLIGPMIVTAWLLTLALYLVVWRSLLKPLIEWLSNLFS